MKKKKEDCKNVAKPNPKLRLTSTESTKLRPIPKSSQYDQNQNEV